MFSLFILQSRYVLQSITLGFLCFLNNTPCTITVDCCDGSDENDGSLNCPNTCIMGGTVEYKTDHRFSRVRDLGHLDTKQTKNGVTLDDFIQKVKG